MTIPEQRMLTPPQQHNKPAKETEPLLPPPATDPNPSVSPTLHDNSEHHSHLYGYVLMAMSSFAFSAMTLCVHIATTRHGFSAQSCFFVRAVLQSLFSYFYMQWFLDIRQMVTSFTPRHWRLLAFRGLIGGFGMISLYTALKLLPVGEAMTIFFIGPIITMLLANVVLGEVVTTIDAFASLVSFIGILLVARPGFDTQLLTDSKRLFGAFAAVFAAFCSACAYVTIRNLGRSVHFITNVFALGFASLLISILLGGAVGPDIFVNNKEGMFFALLSALCAFVAQGFLSKGLQHCPVGPGILVRNLDVPLAYIGGLLFLGEKPSWFSLAGSALVLTGTLLIGLRKVM